MNNKIYLFLIILLQISMNLFSQNISGKVTNTNSGLPIPGVIIEIPELQKGTITNEQGMFSIYNIPNGNFKMQIRYIGYKTEILNINNSRNNFFDIKLQNTDIETQAVVISGGNFSPAHTNAVKVESISLSDFTPSVNISSFLTSIAGVDIISKGNGVTKPVIRGLSGTNILVLKNGFRLENYQFSEDHPFIVDATGTDRIEIIKGPASLLYGSDAIGGIINFIPEKPAKTGKLEADYNASFFTNSKGIVQNIGLKASSQKFMWGFRSSLRNNKDFYDGNNNQVPNSRFNKYMAKAFFIFNTKKAIFKLNYEYSESKFGMSITPAMIYITDNARKNEVFYQNLKNQFITSQNSFFIAKNLKLKANFSYENNDRAFIAFDSINPPIHMLLQTFSYETKVEYEKNKITIITGIQGYLKDNKNLKNAQNYIIPNFSLNSNAVFSLLKWNAFKNFFFQTGIRYEKSSVKIPSQEYYSNFNNDTSMFFSNLSGSLGATYKLTHFLNIRTNLATGYRMPNLPELTQYGFHADRFEQGNINLKSQRSYEGDFSVHFHSKKVFFDFSTFYNKIDNYIFLSPTNTTAENGMEIYQYLQNDALIYGFETGIELYPLKKLDFKATYNYTIGIQGNEFLPLIPQNKLRAKIKYNFGDFKIFKNLNIDFSGLYAFNQNKVSNFEEKTSAYNLFNSSINFKTILFNQKFLWKISAENIFNTKYNDHLSTLKEIGFLDMGRNFSVNLKIPLTTDYK